MDILVRNINPKIITRIDKRCQELTTKTGKKMESKSIPKNF